MPGIQSTLQLSCLGSKKGRSRNFSQTQLSYYIHLRLLSGIAFDSIFNLFRASGIFQKTRNLVCISILKKVQWQLIFDALLLLNQKLLRKSLRLGFFFPSLVQDRGPPPLGNLRKPENVVILCTSFFSGFILRLFVVCHFQ